MVPRDAQLEDLLRELFPRQDELVRFLSRLEGGRDLVDSLPVANASLKMLAYEAVRALDGRGLLDGAFFSGLISMRPRCEGRLVPIAQQWVPRFNARHGEHQGEHRAVITPSGTPVGAVAGAPVVHRKGPLSASSRTALHRPGTTDPRPGEVVKWAAFVGSCIVPGVAVACYEWRYGHSFWLARGCVGLWLASHFLIWVYGRLRTDDDLSLGLGWLYLVGSSCLLGSFIGGLPHLSF